MSELNASPKRRARATKAVLALLAVTALGAASAGAAQAEPRGPCDGACPRAKVLYNTRAFSTPYLNARTQVPQKAGIVSVECEAKGAPAGRHNHPWWSRISGRRWVHNGDLRGGALGRRGIRYCAAPANDAPPPAPVATIQDKAVGWALSKVGTRECQGEQPGWVQANGFSACSTNWCGIFVREAYRAAGVDLGSIAYTEDIYNYAKARKRRMSEVPVAQITKGDLVLMYTYYNAGRRVTHVGMATGPVANGSIPTVEGNISDKVVTRSRSITATDGRHKLVVMGVRIA